MEFGSILVTPSRSVFAKADITNTPMRSFDFVDQTKFTTSFLSFVQNSLEVTDTQLLEQIMPKQLSDLYSRDLVINEIVSICSARGIRFDQVPIPVDHFTAIQKAIFKSSGGHESVYTPEMFADECDGYEFNFVSAHIYEFLTSLSDHLVNPVVVLYYTPLGFLRLNLPDIDIADSDFFIVLSQDLCIFPELRNICVTKPINFFGERRASFTFFPIIKFDMINGFFHPNYNDASISHFTTNCTNFPTRLDMLSFPYDSISGRSVILNGLIGRYSQIKYYLSNPDVKVDVIEYFDDINPFIGIYMSKTAYVFMFLYIPNDFAPSHPMYTEVSNYAISFMHRVCSRTLFLSEDDAHFTMSHDFSIGGLPKLHGNRILGNADTSLILHNDLTNCVGKMGRDSIQFDACDEFLLWKRYISRRYQTTAISSQNEDKDCLPFTQVVQLLVSDDSRNPLKNVIKGVNQLSEIDELIRNKYIENQRMKNDTSETAFIDACNKKMDLLTVVFNQAAHWTKAAAFVAANTCEFCSASVENKPDQDSSKWSSACFRCKLEKNRHFNESTKGAKRPLQFLEENVDFILQNEKDSENLLNIFRSYFSDDQNLSVFSRWFFEYWTKQVLNIGIKRIKSNDTIEIIDEFREIYDPNEENFSLLRFINKLTGLPLEGVEYYLVLPNIFLQVPFEIDSDNIRAAFLQYFIDNIIPEIIKPPEMTPYLFLEKCKIEMDIMAHSGFVEDSVVEIKNVTSTQEGRLDVEICWVEKNVRDGRSANLTFNSISDISLLNPSFASKPVNCEPIVYLYSQPPSLFVVNSFHIMKQRTIIVSALGSSLWINVVKDGYNSSFLPTPVYSMEIDKDSGKNSFCSYASSANLIILLVVIHGESHFFSIQISRDFTSSNIVVQRPFRHLSPLSARQDFSPHLYGFTLSSDATVGVFCSDYCYDSDANIKDVENNRDENRDDGREYALVRFNPWTLIAYDREDSFDVPFSPIFVDESQGPPRLICHCEKGESSLSPKNSSCYIAPFGNGHHRLDSIIGVVLFRNEPRVARIIEGRNPVLLLPDSTSPSPSNSSSSVENVPFVEFSPRDAVNLTASAVDTFGMSEVDRIGNSHYPIDSVTVEAVFDLRRNSPPTAADSYFSSGKEAAKNGIEMTLIAHQKPFDNFNIMNIDPKPTPGDPKRSFFPFFHRITGSPRFLIQSPAAPTIIYTQNQASSVLETSFIKRRTNFPPIPLIRELITKGEVTSKTISIVDTCSKGQRILSAYSGLQFISAVNGSVSLGSIIVPKEFNRLKKFENFFLLNSVLFLPVDFDSATHCALSLLHSIACSGVSVFTTRRNTEFVAKVFEMMRDSIPAIEEMSIRQHLDFDNENLQIVVVCDLGYNREKEIEKLRNEIGCLLSGFESGQTFFDIMNKELIVLPIEDSPIEIARTIADNVLFPSCELEKATKRIFDAAATYGSFIDNSYLFKFE